MRCARTGVERSLDARRVGVLRHAQCAVVVSHSGVWPQRGGAITHRAVELLGSTDASCNRIDGLHTLPIACPTYYWHNYRQACAYLVDNDAYELPQAEDTAYGLNGGLDRNGVSPQQFDR